ncbi:MAG TPA: hypothetical protein VH740_11415 [Vicinamibacterales bacterium]|jgi:hypothetical protein
MNCQTLREAIVDVARGVPVGPGSAAAVEAHVEYCAACAAYLARERALSAGLRAIAEATSARVSPEIEARLRIAFAERQAAQSVRTRVIRSRWLPAAAMVMVVAGAAIAWRAFTALVPAPPMEPPGVRAPQQPLQPAPPSVTFAEGFVPLPVAAGLPDFESGSIIRVEIPVASLPTYGIEIVPDVKRTPVQADLLVGQDGQARAIRLVRSAIVDRTVTP